uniref:Uncharacterized protein n=1 Tax=Octopus bimaculoides TaxID=37653 RepID=A0A0L8HUR7_OCTBM
MNVVSNNNYYNIYNNHYHLLTTGNNNNNNNNNPSCSLHLVSLHNYKWCGVMSVSNVGVYLIVSST